MKFWFGILLGLMMGAPEAHARCNLLFNRLTPDFVASQPKTLRIMTLNARELSINAHAERLDGLGEAIRDINPDIAVLQEISSQETLDFLAHGWLASRYKVVLTEGNTPGSEIGFLVRNGKFSHIEVRSFRDETWVDPTTRKQGPLFQRDLPALIVRGKKEEQPLMIVLGHHAKSQISRDGDPQSTLLRSAQHERISQIVSKLEKEFGTQTPILVAGDFNTDIRHSSEIKSIRQKMKTVFEVDPRQTNPKELITHTLHRRNGERHMAQLDGIFVNPPLWKRVLNSFVYFYKNKLGQPRPLPDSYHERQNRPSDHMPVVADIGIELSPAF